MIWDTNLDIDKVIWNQWLAETDMGLEWPIQEAVNKASFMLEAVFLDDLILVAHNQAPVKLRSPYTLLIEKHKVSLLRAA